MQVVHAETQEYVQAMAVTVFDHHLRRVVPLLDHGTHAPRVQVPDLRLKRRRQFVEAFPDVGLVAVQVGSSAGSLLGGHVAIVRAQGPGHGVHLGTGQKADRLVDESFDGEGRTGEGMKGTQQRAAVMVVDYPVMRTAHPFSPPIAMPRVRNRLNTMYNRMTGTDMMTAILIRRS